MAYELDWLDEAESNRKLLIESLTWFDTGLKALYWVLTTRPWRCEKIGSSSIRSITLSPFPLVENSSIKMAVTVCFEIIDETKVQILWMNSNTCD